MGSYIKFPDRSNFVPPPAAPAAKAARKKPMKRISAKKRKLLREVQPMRRGMVDGETCIICRQAPADDPHEIAGGNAKEACMREPLLIMPVCRTCHDLVQHRPGAEQIALKAQ